MTNKVLIGKIAKAYALTSYLKTLREAIGHVAYESSFIRREHGTGQGFFSIGNTGSYDCLKETLRGITDGLDLRFGTFQKIPFVSESCRGLAVRSKDVHRIEHTIEISAQYKDLESRYILGDETISPNKLGRWFIENQIVCLIEQAEQVGSYTEEAPFHKYSVPIYYQDRDVSHLSHAEIRSLNQERFSQELSLVDQYDFAREVDTAKNKLIQLHEKHRLPPLDMAIALANEELELLYQHYWDKVKKVTTPGSPYYNEAQAARWNAWKACKEK